MESGICAWRQSAFTPASRLLDWPKPVADISIPISSLLGRAIREGRKLETEQRSKPPRTCIASLGLGLLIFGPAAAQAGVCAPPPPWSEADAQARPLAEVEACLKVQAWETRNLNVPIESAVAGIVAQCEVRVTFSAGPAGSASRTRAQQLIDANDRVALDEALDNVTSARRCAGR